MPPEDRRPSADETRWSTNRLHAGQLGLYVLLLDGDVTDGPRLNGGPEWLADALPGLLEKGTIAGVKHFYIGHSPEAYGELLGQLPAEVAREGYANAEPEFELTVWDKTSRMLLYKAGHLWSVPGITSVNGELVAEDQQWLVHRLGAEPDGAANRSQPVRPQTNQSSAAAASRR